MSSELQPAVVLVRPQEEGNVGAAARAMANMGLERLLLVEPAPSLGRIAYAFAVGARHVLDNVERHDSLGDALGDFQRVVGTTSGRHRQLEQQVVDARQLPTVLAARGPEQRIALVFGPEASGLNRDELALCDPLVSIPCAAIQPTLNLAQAVLLVTYELHTGSSSGAGRAEDPAAEGAAAVREVDRLLDHVDELLRQTGFDRDDTYAGVVRDLRQLAARARPSDREVQILHGICRRTLHSLEAVERGQGPRSDS